MTGKRDTFEARIADIQPSQLFLNDEKLKAVQRQAGEGRELDPVPVMWHEGRLVALDGHHRLYIHFVRGDESIAVYLDKECINTETYAVAVKWCRDEGITSIKDLSTRIIDRDSYKVVWIEKCQRELP